MRNLISSILAASLLLALALFAQDTGKKPPTTLVFTTKNGNVTFNHAEHLKRAKNDCKTCHDSLFKQDSKAPLNYKAALHKTAETDKTSCGFCHHMGGAAFESKANCAKCHVKG